MAPALTKILKNGHGTHLSSPPTAVRTHSEGRAMRRIELQPHMRPIEDDEDDDDLHQKMWNLSSFHTLDSCLASSLLDTPASPMLLPWPQRSDSQIDTMSLSSPNSLVNLPFFNKGSRDSHQVASVFPDVPDMFLTPGPEHNRQQACLLHGRSVAPECGPDGGDVHHSSLNLSSVFPSYSQWEFTTQGHTHFSTPPPSLKRKKAVGIGCPPPASAQPCSDRVNPDQLTSKAVLEEAAKAQLSRQTGLQSRAWRLRKRLQTVLGEHAARHCNQQLEGLAKHCLLGDLSLDCRNSLQESNKPHFPRLESPIASSSLSEVGEFNHLSQVVLRGLHEALDSEATASSSSDEEPEEENFQNRISSISSHSSCEMQWLEERAEISSRWSWLELRLAELEGNIHQLVDLSKHIRSTKGGVVLADFQPLTDRQIQQTLLKEVAGLSCTASDTDNEPYSPTRLLRNIERQSAQLSQLVNSLISPLSFSPLSKQPQTWKDKGTLTSGQRGDAVFIPASAKKRRLRTRRLIKADVSRVCARARPLVSYHKPRLFTFNSYSLGSPLDSGKSMTTLSSLLSSSCSSCSSCDPVACSSRRVLLSDTLNFQDHPVSSLSFGTPTCHHLKRVPAREVWSQRPLLINSPANHKQHSSTALHNSHKYKQHTGHHKSRVRGLSPSRFLVSARGRHSKTCQRKREKRRIHRLREEEEGVLYRLCDPQGSSDDVLEESYAHVSHKQASQGLARKRQGESVYNINNIVIPMPLAKVEKLQYKDILIPSWQVVCTQPLMEREGGHATGQAEDLSDEAFAQRHLALEQKEKSRWSSWDKRKRCKRPTRSGSRLLGSRGVMYTSGEESSVEWSCTQLDLDDLLRSEEWLPQTPWEPRVFPLDEVEEVALLSEKQEVPLGRTAISSASSTSKSSNSHPAPPQSSYAALPSVGQSKNSS